jgi:hypothetical protein
VNPMRLAGLISISANCPGSSGKTRRAPEPRRRNASGRLDFCYQRLDRRGNYCVRCRALLHGLDTQRCGRGSLLQLRFGGGAA